MPQWSLALNLENWYVKKLDGYLQNDYQAVELCGCAPLLEDELIAAYGLI
jgi:hypothetical protein